MNRPLKNSLPARIITYLLCFTVFAMPYHAIAAEVSLRQSGLEAQSFGDILLQGMSKPTESGGSISFPDSGMDINVKDLYPGSSGTSGKDNSYFSPSNNDLGIAKDIHADGYQLDTQGAKKQGGLFDDATGGRKIELGYTTALDSSPTMQGAAYKIILDRKNTPKPDLRNDPVINTSRDVVSSFEDGSFSDCSVENTITRTNKGIHVPEYESCVRIHDRQGEQVCRIKNDIVLKSAPINETISVVGVPLTSHHRKTYAKIHDPYTRAGVLDHLYDDICGPNTVGTSVSVSVRAYYASLPGTSVGGARVNIQPPYAHGGGNHTIVTEGGSIPGLLNPSNARGISLQQPSCSNGLTVRFDSYGASRWSAYANIARIDLSVTYKTTGLVIDQDKSGWSPQECIRAAKSPTSEIVKAPNRSSGALFAYSSPLNEQEGYFSKPGGINAFKGLTSRFVKDNYEELPVHFDTEFCTATTTVTGGAKDNTQCSLATDKEGNTHPICPGTRLYDELKASPIPGIPKNATEVTVNYWCDNFFKGDACYTDLDGNEICEDNDGTNQSDCKPLEDNPKCGLVKSTCVEGAEGDSGACYVFDEVWDCGTSAEYVDEEISSEYICSGPISCMGTECINVKEEKSDGFAKAAALLNVVEHADGMMSCVDGADANDCTIFGGEKGDCKKAVGGAVDCCEKPKGVNLGDYLAMLQAVKKVDSAMLAISQAKGASFGSGAASGYVTKFREPVQGAYNNIIKKPVQDAVKPVVDSFKELTSPFVNYAESSGGIVSVAKEAGNKVLQSAYDALGEKAQQFVYGALEGMGYDSAIQGGAAVGSEAVVKGATGAAESANQALAQTIGQKVGAMISFIGWVYLAYQVATLIITMIYKCTKDELELMVNVELRKCSYVGSFCDSKKLGICIVKKKSYCCYDSPLARIVVEQGYAQLGMSQGSAKNPQCNGLTIGDLDRINWDTLDLSEWTGLLIQNSLYAGTANITPDSLTGSGSYLPGEQGSERMSVGERTKKRFEDSIVDDIRVELSQEMDFSGGEK